MLYRSNKIECTIEGELACFTPPSYRTDRVSYPVMPPTAALGVVSSIAYHPEAQIHDGEDPRLGIEVHEIAVLKPLQTTTFRLNEVGTIREKGVEILSTSPPDKLMQTSVCALKDVKYRFTFSYVSYESGEMVKKWEEIFKRRLQKGQCFRQPCLGRRRYVGHVKMSSSEDPINLTMDLGSLPWRVEYYDKKEPRKQAIRKKVLHTFPATMRQGVVEVPSFLEDALQKGRKPRLC